MGFHGLWPFGFNSPSPPQSETFAKQQFYATSHLRTTPIVRCRTRYHEMHKSTLDYTWDLANLCQRIFKQHQVCVMIRESRSPSCKSTGETEGNRPERAPFSTHDGGCATQSLGEACRRAGPADPKRGHCDASGLGEQMMEERGGSLVKRMRCNIRLRMLYDRSENTFENFIEFQSSWYSRSIPNMFFYLPSNKTWK